MLEVHFWTDLGIKIGGPIISQRWGWQDWHKEHLSLYVGVSHGGIFVFQTS